MSAFGRYLKGLLDHKPDLPDDRDRPFLAPAPLSLPLWASVDDERVAMKDQEGTSSCVGQATSVAARLGFLKLGVACPDLSALWVYRAARTIDGTAGDEGTYLRSGVKAGQKIGFAREADFPFDADRVNAQLTLGGAHSGFDRRGPRAYYRILNGVTGVRQALADGYPVIGGWQVDDAFVEWNGARPMPARTGVVIGGHALCLVSYGSDGTFQFRNSWGTGWGIPKFDDEGKGTLLDPSLWPSGGYGWASEAWVAQASDVWAIDLEIGP